VPVFLFSQDGSVIMASDGSGEYPVVRESRYGTDGLGVVITLGIVAYVTKGARWRR
jgi:gephyrin